MKSRFVLGVFALTSILAATTSGQSPTGLWEGEIADPRRPQVITVDFDRAVASISGGDAVPISGLVAGSDNAVDFDVRPAGLSVHFAGRRAGDVINGTMKAGTRELRFTVTRIPAVHANASREVAWQEDLDALSQRFLRYDRSFTAQARAGTSRRIAALRTAIPRRTDQQILVELARIVALSDNAHTRLYFVRNRTEVRRLPVRGWWFGEEFRIVRATAEHQDLLGCRVLKVGRAGMSAAFRELRNLKAGNASWQRYMTTYYLTSPDVLAGAGVTTTPDEATLEVECANGRRRVTLRGLPLVRSTMAVEAWWDLVPNHPAVPTSLLPVLKSTDVPLYLQHPGENYWFEYLANLNAVYVQYNRAEGMPASPLPAFAERVAQVITDRKPRACIIDLRFNTGGNLDVGTPLVDRLAPLCRPLRVFILTGRATFSAGITHTAQWKQATGGTIIGEPVGDRLDFWSEGGNLILPHSGLTVHYANAFHRYSTVDYPARQPYYFELRVTSLAPDIQVEPTWDDYINGRDPAVTKVATRLK
jgi:hypothetical protein